MIGKVTTPVAGGGGLTGGLHDLPVKAYEHLLNPNQGVHLPWLSFYSLYKTNNRR